MSILPFRNTEGGLIDRSQTISFQFNGKTYQGFAGDSLASALIANNVFLTARSFKYHRPRGIVGSGYEEPSSLVELAGDEESGNQPITRVQIRPGLDARSVNCWPSPEYDLLAVNQFFSKLIPAAFYYKTFKWPNWRLFEPSIRRAAGLASAPEKIYHEGHYETRYAHCDVLVVGAGPAGLVAALQVARSGARVILADDGLEAGGSLLSQRTKVDGMNAIDWVRKTTATLDAMDNVIRLTESTVWAYREHNLLMITERSPTIDGVFQRSWRVRASQVLIATGAIERNLVFANNDKPGVMMASAIQAYINRYAVKPGQHAVLFGNNNSIYDVARDLLAGGIELVAIIDSRSEVEDLPEDLKQVQRYSQHVIEQCHGGKRLRGVTIKNRDNGQRFTLDCDLLGISGGWNPAVHLYSQSRSALEYDARLATFVPGKVAVQSCQCIGAANGEFTLSEIFETAIQKTSTTLESLGKSSEAMTLPSIVSEPNYAIEALWHVDVSDSLASKSFIDIQNDVTLADVHLAMREGFEAVEHVKRYTTAGMGIDQGKTGNLNVIGAIALKNGCTPDDVGTTTFRAPYVPIEFGSLIGVREESVYLPYRHTAITQWNKDHGAEMYESGARWRRPGYYPRSGETFQETVNRESLVVREGLAVYDGAPLGKFEIKGPDALKFIEMLYTNNFASLKTSMGRYGLMLNEDGIIIDDGVTFKLAENHYFMSTSTGHADAINQHMEFFLQTHRPEWKVKITTVTTQWANATLCGPKAREMMQALGANINLSNEAMPFMAMREGRVAGFMARVCRVSFTGEMSYEVNVRARDSLALWETIMEVGKSFDIAPVGSESNHVLRVEKGFLSLGHEADGTTTPYDLGMDWIMSKTKSDYIGKKANEIRLAENPSRWQLVGLLPDDPEHLIDENAPITPGGRREASEGFVTACVWSVVHKRVIALALLEKGQSRMGETIYIRRKEVVVTAKVTAPCFYDPEGKLLRS
ncbi:MAG: sarcosine oxidase subunit alpha [Polaribacter sp.]|jgi:sarcosine oxidase subunit alpha